MIRPIVISCPFGNYFQPEHATPTLGTYTFHHRAGPLKRIWRVLASLRPLWRARGWINRLGLPNPGIDAAPLPARPDAILSIHGFGRDEWDLLADRAARLSYRYVELNVSCPNVGQRVCLDEIADALKILQHHRITPIVKLPPVRWMDWANPLFDLGVSHFHACNTIPTPGGGISGKPLKTYSLWAVEELRTRFGPGVTLIGGGGVTGLDDIRHYVRAGADHVAVGSALLNPLRWRRVRRLCRARFNAERREVYFDE